MMGHVQFQDTFQNLDLSSVEGGGGSFLALSLGKNGPV